MSQGQSLIETIEDEVMQMAMVLQQIKADEKVVEIEMERLRGFENHPFKVRADSQIIELQESIKKYGILNPLIVRPKKDGGYEIMSGHRKKFAAEKSGYRKVPVIIRVLSLFYTHFITSENKREIFATTNVCSYCN